MAAIRPNQSGDKSPHCYVNVNSQLSQREAVFLLV